ncbi:MAG: DegT/DnrJ/EryC1/StrS family aminotransferase [Candidatus Paceibacterota bacterium]
MIPITKPYFDNKEIEAVKKVIKSGWIVQGNKVKEFEEMVARYIGVKYAIAVSSCTAGLHLSLEALGIGIDNEVIIPSFTFAATANVVENQKAKTVFVDIEPDTFNIDASKIEKAITKNTKAIMPVHLFGLSANMAEIVKIAKKHNLSIIEDAACALGTKYKGKHVGTFGSTGCFSFHPRKAITTGEGGMVVTNNKKTAEKLISLRDHGSDVSDFKRHKSDSFNLPDHSLAGFNYRMTDIQAAIGVEQMKKLPLILKERKRIAENYNKAFKNVPYLLTPPINNSNHTYQSYILKIKEKRNDLAKFLIRNNISSRPGTQSVPHLSYYKNKYGYNEKDFNLSFSVEKTTLTLPLYVGMKRKDQDFIINKIKYFFHELKK